MHSIVIWLATVVVSTALSASAQTRLPPPEQALIIAVQSSRQLAPGKPYDFRLASGARLTVTAADVHDAATELVRAAMAEQAWRPVEPANLFVLQVQRIAPVSPSQVSVTLMSGSVVRLAAADVRDPRLTFLRTVLGEAAALESWERAQRMQQLQSEYLETAQAKIRENWKRVQGTGSVTMKFVIHRDGRISNVEVEQSAGEALDLPAVLAVTVTRQVAPFPPEFPDRITVHMVFDYAR
jgi:TonB family protein